MSDGDLSALLTFLAIPAGGLIAAGILWAMLRPPKGVTMNTDPTLKPDIAALQKRLAEDPGFAAEVTGDRPRAKLNDEAPSDAAHWHKRTQAAETEARTLRLRYGVVSGWIVQALKVLDTLDPEDSTEADELGKLIAAGEMLALTTLANSKTPNKPLRRGVDGVCTRSTCECEREGLGDQCVWLKPAEAEFKCFGEPSLCANPRGCACVPDSKTPNAQVTGRP
jgi:hypothetical protein